MGNVVAENFCKLCHHFSREKMYLPKEVEADSKERKYSNGKWMQV